MELAIYIEDLLNKQKLESNRIELKKVGILQAYIIECVLLLMISMILALGLY